MLIPVEVYELTGASTIRRRLQAAVARGLTKFVGRDIAMDALIQALERSGTGHGQIVAAVGEPGVGKSCLVYEFVHSHIDPRRISPGYDSSPIVSVRCSISEDSPFLQLDPPQRRQRTLDGLKRILLRESQVQPLVLVFEDLHWIDSETQALLDGLVESLPTAQLLLLVNYRPEYTHNWGSKTYYTQLRLDPLSPGARPPLNPGATDSPGDSGISNWQVATGRKKSVTNRCGYR